MKDKIQSKVAKAFSTKLADAVDSFTCTKTVYSGDYDYVTETYPISKEETYNGRGILFGSYLKDMVKPTDYQTEDAKALVLQNECTATPQINDEWQTEKGLFQIVNIGADPTDSIWIAQIRKVSE